MQKIGMSQVPAKYERPDPTDPQKSYVKKRKIFVDKIVGATWLVCEKLKVLAHKTHTRDGYAAMVLGFGVKKLCKINKPQQYLAGENYEEKYGPEKIYEYRSDELLPIGSDIDPVQMFPEGSYVDVIGKTKGRGFSGVMKVWNFHGGRASHGTTKAHRTPGSSGGKRAEGRVMPGKKGPKNYGNEQRTVQNIRVIFSERLTLNGKEVNLIGLDGGVPGCNSRLCYLRKAIKKGVK